MKPSPFKKQEQEKLVWKTKEGWRVWKSGGVIPDGCQPGTISFIDNTIVMVGNRDLHLLGRPFIGGTEVVCMPPPKWTSASE